MKSKTLHLEGVPAERSDLNAKRLEWDFYESDNMFHDTKNIDWPGDWIGRTMLALVSQNELTGREQKYWSGYRNNFRKYVNDGGFYGDVFEKGKPVNEQAVAGNSWFLRALCRMYEEEQDDCLDDIVRLVENFLPLKEAIANYSVRRKNDGSGGAAGELLKSDEHWIYCSDVGCVFIGLDGLTHAYEILQDDRLRELIDVMFERFRKMDPEKSGFQTHATLCAVRSFLKMYEVTGNKNYLIDALKYFELYRKKGLTVTYANFNWFGRNDFSEMCCVIDSLKLGYRLYDATGNPAYLWFSRAVQHNAFAYGQRETGGFGSEVCVDGGNSYVCIHPDIYEAYWCCTMRGADGFYSLLKQAYAEKGKNVFIRNFIASEGTFAFGSLKLQMKTDYPYNPSVMIEFENTDPEVCVRILQCRPQNVCAEGCKVEIDGDDLVLTEIKKGKLSFNVKQEWSICEQYGKKMYTYGTMRLVVPDHEEMYRYADFITEKDGKKLMNIPQLYRVSKELAMQTKLQILF